MRKINLLLTLLAGLVPAFAQAPPPVPALPDTERRTSYSITGSTCACSVGFSLYGDSTDYQNWIEVWLTINGALTNVAYNDPTYGWVLTSPTGSIGNIPRPITDAIITFNNAQTGTVQIVGARRPRRATQFTEGRGVAARDLNQAMTDQVAQMRELWDKTNDVTGRSILALPGEILRQLPPAATRANTILGFDGLGNVTTYLPSSAVSSALNINYVAPYSGAVSESQAAVNGQRVSVFDFGADPTGSADSTAAINAAIASGKNVYIPWGTYKVSGSSCPTISTQGQIIYGDGQNVSVITSACTGNTLTINDVSYATVRDIGLTRTTSASSGQDGIHCNTYCDEALIQRVAVQNHYYGLRLAGASYSKVDKVHTYNNYSHGIYVTNVDSAVGFQWTIKDSLSEQNGGDGMSWQTSTVTSPTGEIINFTTFANAGRGISFLGSSGNPLSSPRIFGGFLGQDCSHELYFDSYSTSPIKVEGTTVELAGTSVCGRNLATSASNTGNGILATANNTDINIIGVSAVGNSYSGIESSALNTLITGSNSRINGAAAVSGELSGFQIDAGTATISGSKAWGNTFGIFTSVTTLASIGNYLTGNTSGSIGSGGSLSGIIALGNSGYLDNLSSDISGDCSITYQGLMTCLKTNGTSFGTAATQNTGTSGANVPLLNGGNTWSGANVFPNVNNYNASDITVNFNTANNDNSITVPTTPNSAYLVVSVIIYNCSASISSATFGLFTGTGGTGTSILGTVTGTVTATTVNTAANAQIASPTNNYWQSATTLNFRTIAAEGSAASCKVQLRTSSL